MSHFHSLTWWWCSAFVTFQKYNVLTKENCSKWHFHFFLSFYKQNKAWYFMWILYLAEHSHEISSLIFSEKQWKKNSIMSTAAVVTCALRVKWYWSSDYVTVTQYNMIVMFRFCDLSTIFHMVWIATVFHVVWINAQILRPCHKLFHVVCIYAQILWPCHKLFYVVWINAQILWPATIFHVVWINAQI